MTFQIVSSYKAAVIQPSNPNDALASAQKAAARLIEQVRPRPAPGW